MSAATPVPPGPPDGGVQAWLQVLGAFMLYMNTWGLLSSYGTLQAYYETQLLQGETSFRISVIGALQSFLLVFLGFLAGPAYDAGFFRHLLVAGSVLVFTGTLAQSFCTQLWQLILAEGACVGIGCGCLGILSVAIPASWFKAKLPLANAIAASGSGVGGVIYPILVRQLIPIIGFGWTIRTMALVVGLCLVLAIGVLRDPHTALSSSRDKHPSDLQSKQATAQSTQTPRGPRRRLVDVPSLTDWPYVLFVLACFLIFLGLYTPFFNVQTFAIDKTSMKADTAFYIVMTMNIASIPGRIIPGLLAARLGAVNLIIIASTALAGTSFGFLGLGNSSSGGKDVAVFAAAIVYGFFTGSFFGLQPTVFVRVTGDMSVLGTRFGMAFTVLSIALLFGTPVSGRLVDQFGYSAAWIWSGSTIIAGTGAIICTRALKGTRTLVF